MQVNHICYIVHIYQICQADLAWNSSLDSLTIHDGGSKSSDQIGKFCGNSLPPDKIISSSHQLLLHFKTNHAGTYPGFQIGYNTLSKFYKSISLYTHSLAPADFSGAVFTCAFFQKMLFLLYKLRNVFLVTNDLSAADLVHADFCQT